MTISIHPLPVFRYLFETDATREDKFHKLLDLYAKERPPPSGDINHRP